VKLVLKVSFLQSLENLEKDNLIFIIFKKALGMEVEILFRIALKRSERGNQSLKDCNEQPDADLVFSRDSGTPN
jgi:hypothetical protein